MVMRNCPLDEAAAVFCGKEIIPFGTGAWFSLLQYTCLRSLRDSIPFVVDNNPSGKAARFCGNNVPVVSPDALRGKRNCVVLLTSPVHMYDMYVQLCGMGLDDSVECYAFPFMQLAATVCNDPLLERKVQDAARPQKIPKTIHGFWFSGEEKPDSYRRCFDTWGRICPDYQIIEWTQENYDVAGHPFCKRAIEAGLWAVASDYARLDVVNRMGGVYMDMDVELLRPLDSFLGNEAVFSFCNNVSVDLAFFAAAKGNALIGKMLKIYDCARLPESREGFKKYFQPSMVADVLFNSGLKFNGQLQLIDGMAFFPRNYFMPLDVVLFGLDAKDGRTHAVHWDNYGWQYGVADARAQKAAKNKKLWEMIV